MSYEIDIVRTIRRSVMEDVTLAFAGIMSVDWDWKTERANVVVGFWERRADALAKENPEMSVPRTFEGILTAQQLDNLTNRIQTYIDELV